MHFTEVFVAGAGFMGSAIAFLIASRTEGKVILYDVYSDALKSASKNIERYSQSALSKGILSQNNFDNLSQRIVFTHHYQEAATSELVIEAIAEDIKAKQELFGQLDQVCQPKTIFASNTSSLSITALASATKRPERFIGMHFFSPAHIMKLLEIIPGMDTAAETVLSIKSYGESLGKTVICSKDMPGFITTRLGFVLINEAAFALMEGLSTAEEIDTGMTLGYNHPMGPLALADFVGLDICLHILQTLYEGFGDPKYRACPLIRQMVAAGHLGRKSGQGFYIYKNH